MTAPAMPPDLDRLLAGATVPVMPAGLIDRIVAEAVRPGRTATAAAAPRRSRARRWTRRGLWSGIIAVNLMLATAVAAAFGGGAISFARIATVAQHVVEHIRHPFHHAPPRPPMRHARRVRPPSRVAAPDVPMAIPRTAPPVAPVARVAPFGGPAAAIVRAVPPVRPVVAERPRAIAYRAARRRANPPDRRALYRAAPPPRIEPVASPPERHDPLPIDGQAARSYEAPTIDRARRADDPLHADGPRVQAPDIEARDDPGVRAWRGDGRRRRIRDAPLPGGGWRRRAALSGGGRFRPLRPAGGGRRPRRF